MVAKKEWTILVYANGSNDLELEMHKARLDLATVGSDNKHNILLQIARGDRELAQILRPSDYIPPTKESWEGVRRYYIRKYKSVLLDELDQANMANPRELLKFVEWGMENYPAEHYIVILAGHGFQFTGLILDYSRDEPYLMGIPGMCNALNMIQRRLGQVIDLLILDVCYMNYIEILYELGQQPDHTVQNMLTYIETGSLGGMPYNTILSLLNANDGSNVKELIDRIMSEINGSLIGYKIDHHKLIQIKESFSQLGRSYFDNPNSLSIKREVQLLERDLSSLIINYKRDIKRGSGPLIDFLDFKLKSSFAREVYSKFAFCRENHWTDSLISEKYEEVRFYPIKLPVKMILQYIWSLNPNLNYNQIYTIYHKIQEYKKLRRTTEIDF